MSEATASHPFPALACFVEQTGLSANPKGILAARLPRILGQGQTRAEGLDMPPAMIERQQELIALSLPEEASRDLDVQREIAEARRAVSDHQDYIRHPENRRRFALQVLNRIERVPTGNKDNQFFAGRLVLVADKGGQNWSWCMTPHYPVIAKIPADIDYVVAAYAASERIVEKWTMPLDRFGDRLALAWSMARQFNPDDNVLIADVARLFKIAAQDDRFWQSPQRRNFEDVPEAVFIVNLINWRHQRDVAGRGTGFDLVPATLNQAHGSKSRAFFVPANAEGTVVRPMIYIRRQAS